MSTFNVGDVKVTVWKTEGEVCIVKSQKNIYLTLEELAGIGEAVAKHLERENELKYEAVAWPPAGEV